ncbi:MAG: ABC transporter ATP-binding protein [Mycoplasmatales bacterium]|nr:ABC transporter ATP-binding protein [Mycoplasmatales bacterium]
MDDKKKRAHKQAKNAKRLLKSEKKDFNSSNHNKTKEQKSIKNDFKHFEKEEKNNKKKMLLDKKREKRISQKREKILSTKNSKILNKFENRQEKRKLKREIKEIDKLNVEPKGQKFIPNSSKDIIIEVKNVVKAYTTKTLIFKALNNISLEIKRGEFVAILGPSGSGKSTLLNIISGLDRPTYGEIIIDGNNVAALSDKEMTSLRRDKIGFVFQSYNLLPTLNVSDNVEIGRSLQMNKEKRLGINDVLNNMNMSDQIKKRTYELSGGQQQRVSIARAIAKSPDILIGDEPTGALDTKSRIQVFKIFQDLNKKKKTTVIIVTHNHEIAKLANKIVNVEDGKIVSIKINKKVLKAEDLGKSYE